MLALTLRGATFREGRLLFGDEKNPRDVVPLSQLGSGTRREKKSVSGEERA